MPDPVSRYLQQALGERTAPVQLVRLRQEGEIRMDLKTSRWLAFTAEQTIKPMAVEFHWNARVRVAPFVHIRIEDGYEGGEGFGRVRILSAITVAMERGSAELNAGELLRFLAEAPWYPTVLLPSEQLRWMAVDASRATAALTNYGCTVEIEFRFDAAGDIAGIYADARPRKVAGGYEMTPWEGHFFDYAEVDGLRVPFRAEVGWHVDGVWTCVWRGRITGASYEFAEAVILRK